MALDTSYLVTTLIRRLPVLQLQIAQALTISKTSYPAGRLMPDTFIALSVANQKSPLMVAQTQQGLQVSWTANPAINNKLA